MSEFTNLTILKEIKLHQRGHYHDPVRDGYHLIFDESDIRKFEILINGPENTSYEAGFFHFSGTIPEAYPIEAPKIKLLTTENSTVRFHSNLHQYCEASLPDLGTWTGLLWTPSMTIHLLCLMLRSVMGEKLIDNEPWNHVKIRQFNTLNFALLAHLNRQSNLPDLFQKVVDEQVIGNPKYVKYVYQYRKEFDTFQETKKTSAESSKFLNWKPLCENLTKFTGDAATEDEPVPTRKRKILSEEKTVSRKKLCQEWLGKLTAIKEEVEKAIEAISDFI